MKKLEYHPFADLFPMFPPDKLRKLAANIKKKGQKYDITLFKGKILDGRNRYEGCLIAEEEPRFEEFEGTEAEALAYVLDHNAELRRNLPAERLAEIGLAATKLVVASDDAITQEAAAQMVGVSRSSMTRAARKKKGPEKTSWTIEELKGNDEVMDLFTALAQVYGNDDARAIRTGLIPLKLSEIRVLARLPKEKMLEIQDLVFAERMTPTHAIAFLNKMADDYSEVRELIQWCVATKGKYWEGNFREGAFTVTVKANRAIKRS